VIFSCGSRWARIPPLPTTQAIHHARDQELTWAQIGELLNITATTAARRYRSKP
jgi:hypothetical protein